MAFVPVNPSERGVASVFQNKDRLSFTVKGRGLCVCPCSRETVWLLSIPEKEVELLCLSVLIKQAWPLWP